MKRITTPDAQASTDPVEVPSPAVEVPASPVEVPSSVVDRLKAIDVTSLDRLVSIRQEQKRVDDYRARAEEKKANVSELVFARVLEDYKKRAASLEQQSTPLRSQARDEYKKLKALIGEVKRTEQQTRLQKDELEFRHAVGELSDEHLAEQLKEPVQLLEKCQSDQAAVDASRARFIEALGSEEALEAPEPPPPVEPATPAPAEKLATAPTPAPLLIPTEKGTTARKPAEARATPPPAPAAAPAAVPPTPSDQTGSMASSTRSAPSAPPATRGAARSAAPIETEPVKTTVLLSAAILTSDAAAGRNEFLLGPLNEIGRAEENHIQIASSNLSRKHAVIRAVPGGFSVTDLGSQNGTFVNGERVTERRLADGDTVELGNVRFVFRTPWPVTSHLTGAGGSGARQPGNR